MIPTLNLPPKTFAQPQKQGSATSTSTVSLFHAALSQPIDFPPLSEMIFEGDKVVFVLPTDLPVKHHCIESILDHVLEFAPACQIDFLAGNSIDLDDEQQQSWIRKFSNSDVKLAFSIHEPSDDNASAYLAASFAGEPIYINRLLFEADTIIPVAAATNLDADGRPCIYPEFSKTETIKRHQQLPSDETRSESRMAHESIGICYAIVVDAGPGGQITAVRSGEFSTLAKEKAESDIDSSWQINRTADAQVVVATIESPDKGQNWEHFFKALIAASTASENARQIVIYSNIDHLPQDQDQGILQIQFDPDPESVHKMLGSLPEAYRALPGIFEETTIFLKSELTEEDVEELGLGFIASDADIQRIVDNAPSGIYLRDAHRCKIADNN